MAPKKFLDLGVSYRSDGVAANTVARLHKAAEQQAKTYAMAANHAATAKPSAAAGRAQPHGGTAAPGQHVVAFAVTQVVNRFLVTQVFP